MTPLTDKSVYDRWQIYAICKRHRFNVDTFDFSSAHRAQSFVQIVFVFMAGQAEKHE